jgi:Domain of unknown function (DUF4276)
MKDLYIVVEGETELAFVNNILLEYFYANGIESNIQPLMIKKEGENGGFLNIEHFKRTIRGLISKEPIITTMIDHYGINSEKKIPKYNICRQEQDIEKRITCMEESLSEAVQSVAPNYRFFVPNIIRHEMETLLFASAEAFEIVSETIKQGVAEICSHYPNIEDINHTPEGAPSKRLIQIYEDNGEKYRKITDGILIAELIGIETMLAKAPRFKAWVEKIIQITKNSI